MCIASFFQWLNVNAGAVQGLAAIGTLIFSWLLYGVTKEQKIISLHQTAIQEVQSKIQRDAAEYDRPILHLFVDHVNLETYKVVIFNTGEKAAIANEISYNGTKLYWNKPKNNGGEESKYHFIIDSQTYVEPNNIVFLGKEILIQFPDCEPFSKVLSKEDLKILIPIEIKKTI